jgi:hypothetical protein
LSYAVCHLRASPGVLSEPVGTILYSIGNLSNSKETVVVVHTALHIILHIPL